MAKRTKTPKSLTIFTISGATGRTCDQLLQSALAQFEDRDVAIDRNYEVRKATEVRKIVRRAAKAHGVICHTVVEPKVHRALVEEAKKLEVPTVDVLGPTIAMLDDYLEQEPLGKAGLSYQVQKTRFDRIDAVDYTLMHDDGHLPAGLKNADVVLVGLSRVSKSVTCFYLAYHGVRAANVPLVPNIDPPDELLKVDPKKVICLTMNANRLASLRESRIEAMENKGSFDEYGDRRAIQAELRYANGLSAKHEWRTLDVSYMSVEEVAREVLLMLGE